MFSITVPNEPRALRAAAEFFNTVAGGITVTAMSTPMKGTGDVIAPSASIETPASQPLVPETPVPDAATVFNTPVLSAGETVPPPQDDRIGLPVEGSSAVGVGVCGPALGVDSEPPVPPPPIQEPPLDSRGLPWDARIHASSRSQVADGSWRNRKCPAEMNKEAWDQYISQIEAELKGIMSVPTPAAVPVPMPPPVPAEAPTAPTPINPPDPPLTFADLTAKITSSGIAFDRVTEAVGRVGLPAYPALLNRPDLIPAVHAELFP